MAFTDTALVFRLTTGSTGTAGNTTAGTPASSLGGFVSTTAQTAPILFDTISDADNRAGTTDYRCVAVVNTTATLAPTVRAWIDAQTSGGAVVTIAVDPTPASPVGSTAAQALTVATETTAPAGISAWSSPVTDATGILLGDLPGGHCRMIWIMRSIPAPAPVPALAGDGAKLGLACDQVP